MYAIFETGGKQYKVAAGDVIRIEKIQGNEGDSVKFENVIAFSDDSGSLKTGTPYLDAATVNATITGAGKGDKVIIFKFKAKKDYRRKQGHRQPYTEIEIDNFTVDGKAFGEKPAKPAPEKEAVSEKEEDVKETAEDVKASKQAEKAAKAKAETKAKAEKAEKTAEPAPEVESVDAIEQQPSEEKAASKMTKADITAKLDELGVEYVKSAKKEELLALLAEAENK